MTRAERVYMHPATGRVTFAVFAGLIAVGLFWDDRRAGDIAAALSSVFLAVILGFGAHVVGKRWWVGWLTAGYVGAFASLQLGFAIAGERPPRSVLLAVSALGIAWVAWLVLRRVGRRSVDGGA